MTFGMIGCGKMGESILAALLRSDTVAPAEVTVCDKLPERRTDLQRAYAVNVTDAPAQVAAAADLVMLAVKPQDMAPAAASAAPSLSDRHLLVSIAAGKRLVDLRALFPNGRLARVMPNLPATVSMGMSAFCCEDGAPPEDRKTVRRLLESFGSAIDLPEAQFDAFTALAGSGPAFVARLVQAMAHGAVALGMDRDQALEAARRTFAGTAMLLEQGAVDEDGLVQAVSSPGGTTVAGRQVLEASDMPDVLAATLQAAAQRGAELARASNA